MKISSLLAFLGLAMAPAQAQLRVPAIFSDHAVLQQGARTPVWGWAAPSAQVTITLGAAKAAATAGEDGRWQTNLTDLKPSATGQDLVISTGDTATQLTIKDVLVGDVWLGSGQSNMAMTVSRAANYEAEQAAAALPTIRMFTERSGASTQAQAECKGEWVVCSASTVGTFSATLYFFGREVQRVLQRPMGLINSSVGGTPIESWVDAKAQQANPDLAAFFKPKQDTFDAAAATALYERQVAKWKADVKAARAAGKPMPRKPQDPVQLRERKANVGGLFNGKIAPLIPYGLTGCLWYQGEANSQPEKSPFYRAQLTTLVNDWRHRWGSELPFAWVQLPSYDQRGEPWCQVREGMFQTLALPNTGMAVTLDLGHATDIHPKQKQGVGERLARWALASVYGKPGAASGPRFAKHEVQGSDIIAHFTHTDGGLTLKGEPSALLIAGEDQQWHPATAKVEGDTLRVTSAAVAQPKALRYGWSGMVVPCVWNGAGLPASPFRTDTWPVKAPEPKPRGAARK